MGQTGNTTTNFTALDTDTMNAIKFVAYSLVAFSIVGLGIVGNLLSIVVLSRPNLKGVMYMYLLGLAMSNLCVLVTAIPALHDISTGLDDTSFATAFYQAHLKLPLINSFMASSVYIIIFMTINRYISIYKPTDFQRLHTAQNAKIHISLSFLAGIFLHIPLCFQNKVVLIENDTKEIHYESVEREDISSSVIFKLYIMISEILLRIGPIITLAVLNALIIYKFLRIAKRRHQLKRYSLQLSQGGLPSTLSENMNGASAISRSSQTTETFSEVLLVQKRPVLERQASRTSRRKSLNSPEERMLVMVLISIVILFVLCTTPAAILSILIRPSLDKHLGFQTFRAIANNLELLNFALNFYIYCLCSAEIRRAFMVTFVLGCGRDLSKSVDTTTHGTAVSHADCTNKIHSHNNV